MIPDAAAIIRMFNAGKTYTEIGDSLGVTKGVVAGRCRRLGLVRDVKNTGPRNPKPVQISAEEQAERALDQRDIDILFDLQEGHSQADCAAHWGVSKSHVQKIAAERARA